jgi:branched-chain amino acid transport system substrate-binding protein
MVFLRRLPFVALLGLLLTGCSSRGPVETVYIGHVAALSGGDLAQGESARQALDLATEDVNKDEANAGSRRFIVLHADTHASDTPGAAQTARTETDVEMARSQVVRLLTVNRVMGLLDDTPAARLETVARSAQPYKIPVVTASPLTVSPLNENVVSTTVAPAYQAQVLARFAAEEFKATSVTVLADNRSVLYTTLADAFAKEWGKRGRRADEASYKTEGAFNDLAGRVKKAAPAAIFVAGTAADLAKLWPLLHAAAPAAPLLFGGEEGAASVVAADPANGTVYVASAFAGEGLTPAGQELGKRYRERFGQDLDARGALAYDGLRLLADAVRRARTTLPETVQKELLGTDDFASLTGPLSFNKDHCARRPVFVVRYEEGKPKMVQRAEAEPKPAEDHGP